MDPSLFVDRRNPDPQIFQPEKEFADCTVDVEADLIPVIVPDLPDVPSFRAEGFEAEQRYHLEVWCEKSTMNDVLEPLRHRYGANLVVGVGETSIPAALAAVKRIEKPARLFYISDFDPAGQSMPVAAARKIQYFLLDQGNDCDVRLFPVALSVDQVKEFRLPRTPIKSSERRRGRFEDRFGEGAVELDALEALHPGALARLPPPTWTDTSITDWITG